MTNPTLKQDAVRIDAPIRAQLGRKLRGHFDGLAEADLPQSMLALLEELARRDASGQQPTERTR
jgi:hypothetical protein